MPQMAIHTVELSRTKLRTLPFVVRSGRGPVKPASARRAHAMYNFFSSKIYEILHERRAGVMHQFLTANSTVHVRYFFKNTVCASENSRTKFARDK